MLTQIKISDFEEWKAMFDSDSPRAREHATGWRVLRGVEDPNVVFVQVEFPSAELAPRRAAPPRRLWCAGAGAGSRLTADPG